QARPALTRPVRDGKLGVEPHLVAGLADAQVQLPVLAAAHRLVEPAHLVEHCSAKHAEVGRLRRTLAVAAVIRRAAEADRGVVRAGDSALEWRAAVGTHDA